MKPGEVVVLRSGGPAMTVVQVRDDRVSCQWFAGDDVKEAIFHAVTLRAYLSQQDARHINTVTNTRTPR